MKRRVSPHAKRILRRLAEVLSTAAEADPQVRNAMLLKLLRDTARKTTSGEPELFYSIREAARRFDVSRTTVSRLYNQLRDEGVLSSAWGSGTLAQPVYLDRNLRLRGRIALLVPLSFFSVTRQYREILDTLADKLWRLGFASYPWFFDEESTNDGLLETIVAQRPDAIVWLLRTVACSICVHHFIDRGIRVIGFGQRLNETIRRTLCFAETPPPTDQVPLPRGPAKPGCNWAEARHDKTRHRDIVR